MNYSIFEKFEVNIISEVSLSGLDLSITNLISFLILAHVILIFSLFKPIYLFIVDLVKKRSIKSVNKGPVYAVTLFNISDTDPVVMYIIDRVILLAILLAISLVVSVLKITVKNKFILVNAIYILFLFSLYIRFGISILKEDIILIIILYLILCVVTVLNNKKEVVVINSKFSNYLYGEFLPRYPRLDKLIFLRTSALLVVVSLFDSPCQ